MSDGHDGGVYATMRANDGAFNLHDAVSIVWATYGGSFHKETDVDRSKGTYEFDS